MDDNEINEELLNSLDTMNKVFNKLSIEFNASEHKNNPEVLDAYNDAMLVQRMMQKNEFNNEAINNLKAKYAR